MMRDSGALTPSVGTLLAWLLVLLLAALTASLLCLSFGLYTGSYGADSARVHAVATEILVPMFQAVLGTLFGAAFLKGTLTYLTQLRDSAAAGPIEFFRW